MAFNGNLIYSKVRLQMVSKCLQILYPSSKVVETKSPSIILILSPSKSHQHSVGINNTVANIIRESTRYYADKCIISVMNHNF